MYNQNKLEWAFVAIFRFILQTNVHSNLWKIYQSI